MTEGVVWSVGDGRIIRPFWDTWIPGKYDSRLGSHPITRGQADTVLAEWIDPSSRRDNYYRGQGLLIRLLGVKAY